MVEQKPTHDPTVAKTQVATAQKPVARAGAGTREGEPETPETTPPPVTGTPLGEDFPQRVDIWPRPPIELTGFQDLNTPGWDFCAGLPGMIVDTGIKDQVSLVAETDIPFGFAVADGDTGTGYCKLATGGTDHIRGIAVRDWTSGVVTMGGGLTGYKAWHWDTGILRVGRIWAQPTTAVKRGDPVGFDGTGALKTGGTAIAGAYWDTDAKANQLAVVQINLNK